ncbi:HU family DNA-binding protein [Bacteroides thetaiotaomicron]|uniref:HU family DNA-binding protein n=1 Tax=Bacteroides thetaiotaomicron TaxID=818 RepID=UPI0040636C8F
MAILVKPVQRANPNDQEAPKKWYVTQVTTAQVDETQVAMDLADETTLNPSEAMMAIRQLRKILLRRLLGGESVKLGNWGSFSVTLSSTGADTRNAVTARNIRAVNLNFQPDEAFKNDLQKATFAWVDKLAEGRNTTPVAPGEGGEDPGSEAPDPTL